MLSFIQHKHLSALYTQREGIRFTDMPKLAKNSQGKSLPLVTLSEAVSLSLLAVSQDTVTTWATQVVPGVLWLGSDLQGIVWALPFLCLVLTKKREVKKERSSFPSRGRLLLTKEVSVPWDELPLTDGTEGPLQRGLCVWPGGGWSSLSLLWYSVESPWLTSSNPQRWCSPEGSFVTRPVSLSSFMPFTDLSEDRFLLQKCLVFT